MNFINDVVRLFGYAITSEEVTAFLARQMPHRIGQQSDGNQYISSPEGGFDLLFSDSPSAPRRHPQYRSLVAAFLFSAGAEKHKEFKGELPFDFSFQDSRQRLIDKCEPGRTWVLGRGRVPVTYMHPYSDSWHTELFNLHVQYREDRRIHHFQVAPSVPFTEEMAPPTWQELALLSDQRRAAMQLYQKENNVNAVEAKRAIDQYIHAQHGT